jgi:lipoic acid synthetase
MERALTGLNTVCREANCPNIGECFGRGTATFMILGDICTRTCRFCAVTPGTPTVVDGDEPKRLAEAAGRLGLKHVVITSVTRDDLPDGGAAHFAACIHELRSLKHLPTVEVLTPDFQGDMDALRSVLGMRPEIFNHNVETVPRLYPQVRPQADFARSIGVLTQAAQFAAEQAKGRMLVKSGLMVGLGETFDEVIVALGDLRSASVNIVTIGQYLKPTASGDYCEIVRYVEPEEFAAYAEAATRMGFTGVASAPLVRSSYHAEEFTRRTIGS